jgi:SAM domain (Sterile alpha motif)
MLEIADWVQKLGLGQYAQVFAENEIEASELPHRTDEDLKHIGVPLGSRRHAAVGPSVRAGTVSDRSTLTKAGAP